jgi:predicted PurR-regulated permease PerM
MIQSEGRSRDLRGDIAFAFGLAVACYLAWLLRNVLLLLYVSALAAVVLSPVVRATSRFKVGRWRPFKGRAILILILAVAGALTAFGFLAFPPVIRDLHEFTLEMPTRLPAFLDKLKRIPFADQVNTDEITTRVQDFISNAATYLLLSIKNWAGAVFGIAMGLILTVYFIL